MFKKLLFTDKCILNTDTNTVIFDFEEDWKEYTKWSQDNIESEYKIQQDKQAELSWNQGAVHKRGSEDRIFHKSGHIFDYKKYSIGGSLIIHNKYFYNGNVMSTYRKRGYLEIKETYIDNQEFLYETIENQVEVIAGQDTKLDVIMFASAAALDEVVIKTTAKRETETALLLDQKKATTIKQSIGAQELSRKGISDAAGAVTKISGISKQEGGGNVYVRGLEF